MKVGIWIDLDFPTEGEEAIAALNRIVSRSNTAIRAEGEMIDEAVSQSVYVIEGTYEAMHNIAFPPPPEETPTDA